MDVNANESCETPTTEKANDPNPAGTTESSKVSLSTRFLIMNSTDFSSSIKALLAMEEYPSLQVSTKITPQDDYILQAKDNDTLTLLQNKGSQLWENSKPVDITLHPRKQRVLEGYPLEFPMSRPPD